MIAIDQDPLGAQGSPLWQNCPLNPPLTGPGKIKQSPSPPSRPFPAHSPHFIPRRCHSDYSQFPLAPNCQQIWHRVLDNGDAALLFVTFGDTRTTITCDSRCLAISGFRYGAFVRDLWAHRDLGHHSQVTVTLGAFESAIFRLSETSS